MKAAVVSEDFRSLVGSAGRARRFLIFEAKPGRRPRLEQYYELPQGVPSFHDLHDDDTTPHPLDGTVLIAAEAGLGFAERLARRGIRVLLTDEPDPHTAVERMLSGTLSQVAAHPHDPAHCAQP